MTWKKLFDCFIYFTLFYSQSAVDSRVQTRHAVLVLCGIYVPLEKLSMCISTAPYEYTVNGGEAPHIFNICSSFRWV